MTTAFIKQDEHNRNELKAYTGERAFEVISGEDRQETYRLNFRQLFINYGENVEFQLRRQLVILCPQTVASLYAGFTPLRAHYRQGTRPALEKVVRDVTAGAATEGGRALALMRFCRDLYKRNPIDLRAKDYVFGGTEEQLILKGEQTCECLGRLLVALCEVAGIPGRIVMHILGGHIGAELYVDGHWAYMDPRMGLYFRKPDGAFASVQELRQDPSLIRNQPDIVKADVSAKWTWAFRAWKCEAVFFHPNEVQGFENYSLADSGAYSYDQMPYEQVTARGLWVINKEYRSMSERVFGLAPTRELNWRSTPLRKLPAAWRNDGFSLFFYEKPPLTRKRLEETYIDPLAGGSVDTLVWNLGPGGVFTYDTRIGEIYAEDVTEAQWPLFRPGDRWAHDNVKTLIACGDDPLKLAVERGHKLGMKVYGSLALNYEKGPPGPKNWMWLGFTSRFTKEHPEYHVPGAVNLNLDFRHEAVREQKLAILRETAEAGADGVFVDFMRPPFFTDTDPEIMTMFMRDLRRIMDEAGTSRHKHIDVAARVPHDDYLKVGIDWKRWMQERLVDIIGVSFQYYGRVFDIPIEEFVAMGRKTGCKVYGCIWFDLGLVSHDPTPDDNPDAKRRHAKPKTREMDCAQAMLFHRAGADGLFLLMGTGDECTKKPWLLHLGDPAEVCYADKHYMVDAVPHIPVRLPLPDTPPFEAHADVKLRIADDIRQAVSDGRKVAATLLLHVRGLQQGETLRAHINDSGPLCIVGGTPAEEHMDSPVDWETKESGALIREGGWIFDPNWWRRGEHKLPFDPGWLRLGENTIRIVYTAESKPPGSPLRISWIELKLHYEAE